jgi:hypothetical protein
MSHRVMRVFTVFLILPLLMLQIAVQEARAAMIGTETVLQQTGGDEARARVGAFLEREEVRAAMIAQGVAPEEAKARVASLSHDELVRVAATIDRLPAGGNGLGAVIGAAVLIFLVLLVTDLIGLTNVFPFVNR